MYVFIALLSAVFLGLYEVFKKVSLKKSRKEEILFFYCFTAFLFSLLFSFNHIRVSYVDLLLIFIKSVVIVVNWLLVLKAMEKLEVGIGVPFSLLNTILIVFGSAIFFKESIKWVHYLSLFFIFGGSILIAIVDRNQIKKDNSNESHFSYIMYLLIGCVLATISALIDKFLIDVRNVNHKSVLVWFFFFNMIMYGIIYFIKNKKINFVKMKENFWIIFTGISIALADLTYYSSIGYNGAELSIISIVRKFSVVVATVLASIFLKEKNLMKKLGILMIMLLGVAFPIFFK